MGIFDLFARKKVDFSPKDLGVDFHSHLIPGIDDGAATIEDSLTMLQGLSDLGYKKVITTPHVYQDYYPNTSETILNGLENVQIALKRADMTIELNAAAEYFIDEHFDQLIEKEDILSFGDRHVLVELSFFAPPPALRETLFKLTTKGYKPILAHPERYAYWSENLSAFQKILDLGGELQVNLLSLTGQYGKAVYKTAHLLIENNMVAYLGSDMHHTKHLNRIEKLFLDQRVLRLIDREWKNHLLLKEK